MSTFEIVRSVGKMGDIDALVANTQQILQPIIAKVTRLLHVPVVLEEKSQKARVGSAGEECFRAPPI